MSFLWITFLGGWDLPVFTDFRHVRNCSLKHFWNSCSKIFTRQLLTSLSSRCWHLLIVCFIIQFAIFSVLGMMSNFWLKCRHLGHYETIDLLLSSLCFDLSFPPTPPLCTEAQGVCGKNWKLAHRCCTVPRVSQLPSPRRKDLSLKCLYELSDEWCWDPHPATQVSSHSLSPNVTHFLKYQGSTTTFQDITLQWCSAVTH